MGATTRIGVALLVFVLANATDFYAICAEAQPAQIMLEGSQDSINIPLREINKIKNGIEKKIPASNKLLNNPASKEPTRLSGLDTSVGGKSIPVDGPAVCNVSISRYNTVSINAQNVKISTVLQQLAVKSRKNIILAAGADRMVSMTLYSVPFYEALRVILDVNGLGYYEENNFIQVLTKEQLLKKVQGKNGMVSRVFRLNYLRPKDAKQAISGVMSKDGKAEIIADDDDSDSSSGSQQNSSSAMSSMGGGDSGSSNSGTIDDNMSDVFQPNHQRYTFHNELIVYDYRDNVEAVGRLLKKLDIRPKQILLEATVIEVSLNENNAFGVDFALLHKTDMLNFFDVGGGLPLDKSYTSAYGGIISGVHTDGSNNTSSFRAGLSYSDVSVFVEALDKITDVSILSSPKVLSLNRQRAKILVGENVGYLENSFSNNQIVQSVKFIESGISLDVRPYVMEGGKVRLVVSPKVSKVEFDTVTTAQNIQQKVPSEKVQTVAADILVPQGATAVIGGLFIEKTQKTRSQIPGFGDIPLVGNAAKRQADQNSRTELVFLIKPVVLSDQELEDIGNGTATDTSVVLSGYRKGLLPWSRIRQCDQLNLKAARYYNKNQKNLGEWMFQRSMQLNGCQPDIERQRRLMEMNKKKGCQKNGILYQNIRQHIQKQPTNVDAADNPPEIIDLPELIEIPFK